MNGHDSTIYTVGHSNANAKDFIDLLGSHAIRVVVDVRSSPSSRFAPHFSLDRLRSALSEAHIRYLFLGKELGGRPRAPRFYDHEGYVLYDEVANFALFRAGLARVVDGSRDHRIALLCSEEDPVACHRRRLVAHELIKQGISVAHIRHDGRLESDHEVAIREAVDYPKQFQTSWIDETSRRSIHPVRDRVVRADRTTFTLPVERWDAFADLLDRDAQPMPGLAVLLGRPSILEE